MNGAEATKVTANSQPVTEDSGNEASALPVLGEFVSETGQTFYARTGTTDSGDLQACRRRK